MDIIVRKYNREDKAWVRRISCETAFLEEPSKNFFDDDELLADALTLYFTDYEPKSCFVAVLENTVVGYLTGAVNIKTMNKVFRIRILPKLMARLLSRGVLFRRNSRKFLFHLLSSFRNGEFALPDFAEQYPATLHININQDYRGLKIGSRLIGSYLDFLKQRNIKGVHFGTMSEGAKNFFVNQGFAILHQGKRTYLKYLLNKDAPYYVLGKLF